MATKRAAAMGANAPALPRERMHLRLSGEVKELLEQAAAVSTGGDVTAFVVGAATERARSVLEDLEITRIDDESRHRFYDLLINPPAPSDALENLIASDRFRIAT